MPSGIYKHKKNQGFQKGHKVCVGRFKNGVPYPKTERGIKKIAVAKYNYRIQLRKRILALLGDKCVKCGFDDPRALQVDHINGGGRRDRIHRKINSNCALYNDLCKTVNKYQLLCANCNTIKRIENKEF